MEYIIEIRQVLLSQHINLVITVLFVSFGMDVLTTTYAVRKFGTKCEGNPIVRYVLARHGWVGFYIFEFAVLSLIITMVIFMKSAILPVTFMYALAVINNAISIIRMSNQWNNKCPERM